MQTNLILFLLLLFSFWITTNSENITRKEEISKWLKNNLREILGVTTISTVDSGLHDNKFKINETNLKGKSDTDELQRKSRYALKTYHGVECISCYSLGVTKDDKNCYNGAVSETVKCADAEICFTELHPQYIKRGCMLPTGTNRTFICKCPLCNDKPSHDTTYYEYRTIDDWKFDNDRLTKPVVSLDLLCKVCETTGRNKAVDISCKNGSSADYMLCGHRQLCYTNVDLQSDFVSRGCVHPPVYNLMHFFCNVSLCNNQWSE